MRCRQIQLLLMIDEASVMKSRDASAPTLLDEATIQEQET